MDVRICRCRVRLKKIILTRDQKQKLIQFSEKLKPNESCAILFGKTNQEESTVKELFLTDNIEESPINFTVSNDQLINAYKKAEEKKLDVVGIFHSHPSSEAVPSTTDKKFMQSNPVVWIIYSGMDKNFRGFVLESDIKEVKIVIS